MFVQVIEGKARDRGGVRAVLDRWQADLAPDARGWLGSTAGVADDGTCVIAARFDSAADARRNSDRPEQGAWWQELVKHFDAPPAVFDCGTVVLWRGGGSDEAGFVQVITAEVRDGERLRAALPNLDDQDDERRPDVLGGVLAIADDDARAFQIVYFTSEEEARRGEAGGQDEPEDSDWAELSAALGEPAFVDLREPWLTSA